MRRIITVVKSFVTWRQTALYSLAWLIVLVLAPAASGSITKYMGGIVLKENATGIPFVEIFVWLFLTLIPVSCTNFRFRRAAEMHVMELPRYRSYNSWWICHCIGAGVSCVLYVAIGICGWMLLYGARGTVSCREVAGIMSVLPQYLFFLSLSAEIMFFLAGTAKSVLLTGIFVGCNIIYGLNLKSPFFWVFGSMGMFSQFAGKPVWELCVNIFILVCSIIAVGELGRRICRRCLEKITL